MRSDLLGRRVAELVRGCLRLYIRSEKERAGSEKKADARPSEETYGCRVIHGELADQRDLLDTSIAPG